MSHARIGLSSFGNHGVLGAESGVRLLMRMLSGLRTRVRFRVAAALVAGVAASAPGAPVESPYPLIGPDDTIAIGASELSGWFAAADSFEDSVEIRDAQGTLVRTITKAEIQALTPWFDLNGNQDGPTALAWSASGRLLFIVAFDSTVPGDGLGSDVVLRYDTFSDALTLFARLEVSADGATWPHIGAAHLKGRLYVGTPAGNVLTYRALRNDTSGVLLSTTTVGAGAPVTGLSVDRLGQYLYASNATTVYRANLNTTLSFTTIGGLTDVRALAYSSHYGGASNAGLYALEHTTSPAGSALAFIPVDQARGTATFAPTMYTTSTADWHDLGATPLGTLLAAADEDAVQISDSSDTRLALADFIQDEFDQVIAFGRGLISPDGEPAGWVIDADVIPAWSRFHPATPDGACWVVLLLLMDDYVNGAPDAQGLVRTILMRYADMMPDTIGPSRSADGYFRHWIDPFTGSVKPGWDPEYASLSTMKIALAADRAAAYYPNDPDIQAAAQAIICGVSDWDSYIQGSDCVYFKSNVGGGPDTSIAGCPFNESIIFVEEAATWGGPWSVDSFSRWINRALWPTATYVTGKSLTTYGTNQFQAAFLSLYSFVAQKPYRASAQWDTQVRNLFESSGAWSDDNGPDYFTVFSAGTTKSEWGGYHADSIGSHPGDVTTFTSLMAMCGKGDLNPAVAAYEAYRNGARETFKSGASILYRRSDVDAAYEPNSAGLPDVALGALGLAELLAPGSLDTVLAIDYDSQICAPPPPPCPGDVDGDGDTDVFDFGLLASQFGRNVTPGAFGDFDFSGFVDVFDFAVLAGNFGCVPAP